MTFRAQLVLAATLLTMATPCSSQADEADDAKVRQSVVKIFATLRRPDVFRPWSKENQQETTGSGVVIAGKRILTNAHMVNHSSQVFIQPDKTSDKLAANVLALASGIDLAVLKLQDETFFDSHPPLPLRLQLPKIQQTVFAYGYPEGGTDLSITRGIVSRLESATSYRRKKSTFFSQTFGTAITTASQFWTPKSRIWKTMLCEPNSSSTKRLQEFGCARSMPATRRIRFTPAMSSPASEITPSTTRAWSTTKPATISSSSIWCSIWYAIITFP
jgi:hypothetical protein